jgi:hypothetical protein
MTMKKTILGVLLSIACGLAIWTFASPAQVIDASPCEKSCDHQHAVCIGVCGEQDNPVECESGCNDDFQDCLDDCG